MLLTVVASLKGTDISREFHVCGIYYVITVFVVHIKGVITVAQINDRVSQTCVSVPFKPLLVMINGKAPKACRKALGHIWHGL